MEEKKQKQLSLRIDEDLHRAFKAAVALKGDSMKEIVEGWIKAYLAKNKQKQEG